MKPSFLLVATAATLTSLANAQTLRDAQRLNTTGFNGAGDNRIDGACVAVGGDVFVTCWTEQFGTTEFSQDIYSSRSTDQGTTWSTPVRVDLGDALNEFDSDQCKIAISDNGQHVVVVWEEKRNSTPLSSTLEDIYCNVSHDGGVTWGPSAFALNTGSAGSDITSDVDEIWIASSGDSFFVVWEEDFHSGSGGAEDIYYSSSSDGGTTWSTPITFNATQGIDDIDNPKVAADGDLVVAAWIETGGTNDDVWVARSTDRGVTFAAPFVIESDQAGNADDPFVDVKGNTVAISWNENYSTNAGGEGAVATVSTDGGLTFAPETMLSATQQTITGSDTDVPNIAIVDEGHVVAVYDDDSDAVFNGVGSGHAWNKSYANVTTDGGLTWTTEVLLANGVTANRPKVMSAAGGVSVLYQLGANGTNVGEFVTSSDGGATWDTPITVASTGPDMDEGCGVNEGIWFAANPNGGDVVAIFMDRPTGNNEVYVCGLEWGLSIGLPYCSAVVNSTGEAAVLGAQGSLDVTQNDLTLHASNLPTNQFGIFVTSLTQGNVPMVGGGEGTLCVGGLIGRFFGPGQIVNSGQLGAFSLAIDLNALPQGAGVVAAQAGETWNFQAWFRDISGGTATSNLTNGLAVTLH